MELARAPQAAEAGRWRRPRVADAVGWIAVLFMIGSACFALGRARILSLVGPGQTITFFAGSLFFTSGARLQYLEVVGAAVAPGRHPKMRFVSWEPRRIDGWPRRSSS